MSSTARAIYGLEEKPIPRPGPGEAVIRVRLTTICGTDIHIVRGEYPVEPGLTIGHEAVGVVHELGLGVTGYQIGERVLVGAITPCGQCDLCLSGHTSQCGGPLGGWKLGNTIALSRIDPPVARLNDLLRLNGPSPSCRLYPQDDSSDVPIVGLNRP